MFARMGRLFSRMGLVGIIGGASGPGASEDDFVAVFISHHSY